MSELECMSHASERVEDVASLFKMLGDETRVRIIFALFDGEKCVSDICEAVDMSQSSVSHQLKLLKMENLVKARREGKNIYYSFDDDHVVDILEKALEHVCHIHEDHHHA